MGVSEVRPFFNNSSGRRKPVRCACNRRPGTLPGLHDINLNHSADRRLTANVYGGGEPPADDVEVGESGLDAGSAMEDSELTCGTNSLRDGQPVASLSPNRKTKSR